MFYLFTKFLSATTCPFPLFYFHIYNFYFHLHFSSKHLHHPSSLPMSPITKVNTTYCQYPPSYCCHYYYCQYHCHHLCITRSFSPHHHSPPLLPNTLNHPRRPRRGRPHILILNFRVSTAHPSFLVESAIHVQLDGHL